MKIFRGKLWLVTAMIMLLSLFPAFGSANAAWSEPGGSDLNIRNGGVMLTDGDDFYFIHGGVFVQRGEDVFALSADDGRNLNLAGGYLYYTVGKSVFRIPSEGGARETVHTASADIKQLYVIGNELRYIADGRAFSASIGGKASAISALTGIEGLIPTKYGNLFLTGGLFDYTLWAETAPILDSVQSCYTDSGYLVLQIANRNYMAQLQGLFNGFAESELEPFSLHGNASLLTLLAPDDENAISEYNENNELMLDFNALLEEAGFMPKASLMGGGTATLASYSPELTQGQINIVKRARQLHEIEWTPLENRTQWGEQGTFYAEKTYTGLPYGQPVNSGGYIGYGVSLDQFAAAVLDNTSKFYTTYSTYGKIAPVYSTDCSGYISYAWGLSQRKTTYTLPEVAEKVGDQSLYSIQVGDCLNRSVSHVVLISGLTYDADGNIIGIEVMEQTPVITKLTRYGAGESRSLASFQSYYLNGGYVIYRYPNRDNVTYTPSAAVPLDGEAVAGQKDKAPKSSTTAIAGGKTVALSGDTPGTMIFYTLDGSTPTSSSTQYTAPITFYDTTKLRAIAVTGAFSGSTVLEYTVKISQLSAPQITVSEGSYSGSYLASESKLSISSVSGATIYYTTDGSEPTVGSKVYSAPITVTSDITVKAIAVAKGYKQSAQSSVSYKLGAVYTINASAGANGIIGPAGAKSVVQTGSASFSITPKSGFLVGDVLVDGVSVGAVTSYTFSNVNANHTISATFKSATAILFTDVAPGAWYYDAVSFAYASALFNGVSETSFAPDVSMTRGMFVTVLGRFAGVSNEYTGSGIGTVSGEGVNIRSGPSTDTEVAGFVSSKNTVVQILGRSGDWYQIKHGTVSGYIRNDLIKVYNGNYSDLPLDQYYSVFAQWASLTGIADGAAGNTFNANSDISREDMCLMLYNYARVYGKTLPALETKIAFTDEAQMDTDSVTAIYDLQQAGVINGVGGGLFSPKGTATRAQVAQIFNKFSNTVS